MALRKPTFRVAHSPLTGKYYAGRMRRSGQAWTVMGTKHDVTEFVQGFIDEATQGMIPALTWTTEPPSERGEYWMRSQRHAANVVGLHEVDGRLGFNWIGAAHFWADEWHAETPGVEWCRIPLPSPAQEEA